MHYELSDEIEDFEYASQKNPKYPLYFYKPQHILEDSSEDIELCNVTRVSKNDFQPVFESFQPIEIIKEENTNIELSSISLNKIKRYKTTMYKDTLNKNDGTCVICCTQFLLSDKIITLKCMHHFHSKCVIPWMVSKKRCPTCRMRIY